jgi:hypothetical protein
VAAAIAEKVWWLAGWVLVRVYGWLADELEGDG